MRKILLLLLSVFVFTACSDEIPEEKVPVKAGRTILAYLISNNNSESLDSNLKENLVDMYSGLAQTTDSCTLLVYYRPYSGDRDGLEGPAILKYSSDGKGNINDKPVMTSSELTAANVIAASDGISCFKEEPDQVATSPETMQRILNMMIKLLPSQSYGVIFGSHGTGWMPGNKVVGRAFGDDNGYSINIPEMAEAMKNVFKDQQLDFILFDACMMATAEVCYEFKDVTDYLIGAVVETHVKGHPYDVIMPKLFQNDVPYDEVCKDYIDFSRNIQAWGTCAAVDCRKMDELAEWVNVNLNVFLDKFQDFDIDDVQQYGVNSFQYFSFDIVDFFKTINEGVIPDGLESLMNDVVVAKDALYGAQYSIVNSGITIEEGHFCGIGMYLPYIVSDTDWNGYYESSISWYNAVGWGRFKSTLD